MQTIGKLIDHIDKNHSEYAPALAIGVVLPLLIAAVFMPSYENYCKEPQAQCKEEVK
jgi:hypothetical protein